MSSLYSIITELRSTSSRLEKEAILVKHSHNERWLKFLNYVYNPFYTYGVSTPSWSTSASDEPDEEFYFVLDALRQRKLTGNEAKHAVGDLMKWKGKYVRLVLNKSLDAGVDVTTINKVYGNIVPTFGVMKAKTYEGGTLQFPLIAEVKYDGFNHTILKEKGSTTYLTSSGKPFYMASSSIFDGLPDGAYMAELIGSDGKLGDRQNCGASTTCRVNSAKGIPNKVKLNWKVFDYVTLEEFYVGKSVAPYHARYAFLEKWFTPSHLPTRYVVGNEAALNDTISRVVKDGWEGLVLKQPDFKWTNSGKRTDAMMKYKKYKSYDLKVVDYEEGKGRLEALIGALVVADGNGRIVGSVGTGLDDAARSYSNGYKGTIVEIKCERISPDGMLIQPVFMRRRLDKTEAEVIPV